MPNEENASNPAALPAPSAQPLPPAPKTKRGGGRGLLWSMLLLLVLAALIGWWRYDAWQREHDAKSDAARNADRAVAAGLARFEQETARLDRELDALRKHLADAERVNRSLREELLGLTERADLVEDALANLADSRMAGRDALLLNEAEFLLLIGAERMSLYRDAPQSLAAYRLADAALAGVNDAALASLRQTVATEIRSLEAAAQSNAAQRGAELAALRAQLESLPLQVMPAQRGDAREEPGQRGWWQRLVAALSPLVRVRSVDAQSAALMNPLHAGLRRSLLLLELSHAESAWATGETAILRRALQRAETLIGELYDPNTAAVAAALGSLRRLAETTAPAPPELGAALKELRNLRATRALAQPPAASVPELP